MEKAAAGPDECFTVPSGDISEMVVETEEVVTSQETVPAVVPLPRPVPQQVPQQTIYSIPTLLATPGSNVMQVVTLQTVHLQQQQSASPQANLTNALRNVRLIAVQPRLPNGLTNGRPAPRPIQMPGATIRISSPRPDIRVQLEGTKKVGVNTFYSRLKPTPVVAGPRPQNPPQQPPQRQPQQVPQRQPQPAPQRQPQKPAQPPAPKPSPSYYREQQREREMKEFSHLSEDLQRGVRILLDLTTSLQHATTWPFMDRVDPVKDGAPDYDQVITKPMWLNLIKSKFKRNEYSKLNDFVTDMRLLLENCYRYNGPQHPITKKALRLEQCLEQKLALLPQLLRAECALPPCPAIESERKTRSVSTDSYFSVLLHRVRHERQEREQRAREKKLEEQRLRREEKERQRVLWAEQMMNPEIKAEMRLMWEIPQIGHFLHLARGALHIGEIAQYELEHMFLMPEASALLATLMTSLLSSPNQRIKLAESPPTPYAVWSARISSRVLEWYRTYNKEGRQRIKVHEVLGMEPMFWKVCGDTNPLEGGKRYHQLSFLKRVWIFKGLCDTVAHSHKTVQEAMAEEEGPETRQVTLGTDSEGFTYLHFPAVSGSDIRVYRQKNWELESDPLWGPITAERKELEEERMRQEELKRAEKAALEKSRKKTARTPTNNRRAKKAASPKKKPATRTPKTSPIPTPQRKRPAASSEERPSRIGTRVSPRTLQRQTGLTLYKDTSSESEDSDEPSTLVEESDENEPEETSEPNVPEDPTPPPPPTAVRKAAPRRKGRGSWRSSRRRSKKKKLPEITEEAEEEKKDEAEEEPSNNDDTMDDGDTTAKSSPVPNGDTSEIIQPEVKEEVTKNDLESVKSEPMEEEDTQVQPESNGPVKEEAKEIEGDNLVKGEEPQEAETGASTPPTTASSQRFTVSQLLQKLSTENKAEEEGPEEKKSQSDDLSEELKVRADEEEKEVKPEETQVQPPPIQPEVSEKVPDIPDPERSSFDPFFFELIVSSVEELQEWIERFQDSSSGRARPRCEVKLRERLQSLLEEAQPLATDQQQANQKICQQLWKEWERYKELERKTAAVSVNGTGNAVCSTNPYLTTTDSDHTQDSGRSDDSDDSGADNANDSSDDGTADTDGVRHSKRLRKRRSYNIDGSTRSSSPGDEEMQPPSKQNRKTSYNYDPGWDSDPSTKEPLPGSSRRQRTFDPEMKNPEYWIGRRKTRATAAFAGDDDNSMEFAQETRQPEEPRHDDSTLTDQSLPSTDQMSPNSSQSSDPLVDQLRQLRRQQALLSSNDLPKATGATSGTPISNGSSPAVFFPSKDTQGKLTSVRISNPKATDFLTKVSNQPPSTPKVAGSDGRLPKRIVISQQPQPPLQRPMGTPVQAPFSIDITNFVAQAVQKGMIVSHEPRHLSIDVGEQGQFLVTAQMTPTGPKVLSATPLLSRNPNTTAAVPVVNTTVDSRSSSPVSITTNGEMTTNGEVGSVAEAATPLPAAQIVKRPAVLVTDTRNSNVISPEILKMVAGPDAGDAKLSIIKEGNAKILTLLLSNGEIRRLTASQVKQIQDSIQNNKKSPTTVAFTPSSTLPTSSPATTDTTTTDAS